MGKLHRMKWAAVALLALPGCSEKLVRDPDGVEIARGKGAASIAPRNRAKQDDRFDANGNLKESGQRLSWLVLPAGFTKSPGATATLSAWEALDMPLAKVNAYLEAHLTAGSLAPRDNGVVYQDAKPSHTQLPMPKMTVTVLEIDPAGKRVRLVIEDLTPPREPMKSEAALARELAEQRKRIE